MESYFITNWFSLWSVILYDFLHSFSTTSLIFVHHSYWELKSFLKNILSIMLCWFIIMCCTLCFTFNYLPHKNGNLGKEWGKDVFIKKSSDFSFKMRVFSFSKKDESSIYKIWHVSWCRQRTVSPLKIFHPKSGSFNVDQNDGQIRLFCNAVKLGKGKILFAVAIVSGILW